MQVNRVVERYEEYDIDFSDSSGSGYWFRCDADGNIIARDWDSHPYGRLNKWAWANLNRAISDYCNGKLTMQMVDMSQDQKHYEGDCDCGKHLWAYGGYDEFVCDPDDGGCGAEYNIFGQRLRANWRRNPSNYDDEIDDMQGYEMEYAGDY